MRPVSFIFALVLFTAYVSGCSSVTVRTDDEKKSREIAQFEQRFHYFWWGLKGNHSVNVRLVCKGKAVEQMQSVSTFRDSFFTLITLGIYAPRTARVWCWEES